MANRHSIFDLLQESIESGKTGELLGIDIVVNYAAWPRAWQIEADWLRFRAEGGYTREVISHFLFLAHRFLGPTTLRYAATHYPDDKVLCELDILAQLETWQTQQISHSTGGACSPEIG